MYVLNFLRARPHTDTPSSSRAVELRPGLSIANDAEPGKAMHQDPKISPKSPLSSPKPPCIRPYPSQAQPPLRTSSEPDAACGLKRSISSHIYQQVQLKPQRWVWGAALRGLRRW